MGDTEQGPEQSPLRDSSADRVRPAMHNLAPTYPGFWWAIGVTGYPIMLSACTYLAGAVWSVLLVLGADLGGQAAAEASIVAGVTLESLAVGWLMRARGAPRRLWLVGIAWSVLYAAVLSIIAVYGEPSMSAGQILGLVWSVTASSWLASVALLVGLHMPATHRGRERDDSPPRAGHDEFDGVKS